MKEAQSRYNRFERILTLDVGFDSNSYEFTGTIGLGVPPQYFKASFDTSTTLSLVVNGKMDSSQIQYGAGYISEYSSTFKKIGGQYAVYNSTTQVGKNYTTYQDVICLGNETSFLSAVGTFGKVPEDEWLKDPSILASFGLGVKVPGNEVDSWFTNVVNQGNCEPYFALYPPVYDQNGIIVTNAQASFCGIDSTQVNTTNIQWIPTQISKEEFWQVGIAGFKLGSKNLLADDSTPEYRVSKEQKEYYAVVDSNSVQMRFPSNILKRIYSVIGALCPNGEKDLCTVDCSLVDSLPTFILSFDLGNGSCQDEIIKPSEYIIKTQDSQCVSGFTGYGCDCEDTLEGNCIEPKQQIVIGSIFSKSKVLAFYNGYGSTPTYLGAAESNELPGSSFDECILICETVWNKHEEKCVSNSDSKTW
ncbi:hypothetical protein HK096_007327 [Nowakowskiella sp. JEL0078]|nr:hypothetical protein HK096_007327 [Nowakowskiella sp. JEL0078]